MYPGLVKRSFAIYLLNNVQEHDETVVTVLRKALEFISGIEWHFGVS